MRIPVVAVLSLAVLIGAAPACRREEAPVAAVSAGPRALGESLEALRGAFERDVGLPRLLVVASPT